MMNMKKTIFKVLCMVLALAMAAVCLTACGNTEATQDSAGTSAPAAPAASGSSEENETVSSAYFKEGEHPQVLFTMENGDTFTVELYPEFAPITVDNFLSLVNSGFYNGLTFHRVMEGFMAQGGDPKGDGTGGSDKQIKGEFAANGFYQNALSHTRGVISMARGGYSMDSASSQFFICYDDSCQYSLDGSYAAFGKVIEGMETVDSFLDGELTYNSRGELAVPVTPIVMKTVEQIQPA